MDSPSASSQGNGVVSPQPIQMMSNKSKCSTNKDTDSESGGGEEIAHSSLSVGAHSKRFPQRNPRVDADLYQVSLPPLRLRSKVGEKDGFPIYQAALRERQYEINDNMMFSYRQLREHGLTHQDLNEYLAFCRVLTQDQVNFFAVVDAEKEYTPDPEPEHRESDEQALQYLHQHEYNIDRAKFAALSAVGMGLDKRAVDKAIESQNGRTKNTPRASGLMDSSKLDTGGPNASSQSGTKGRVPPTTGSASRGKRGRGSQGNSNSGRNAAWKDWVARCKLALSGGAPCTRDGIFSLKEEAAGLPRLLASPVEGSPEQVFMASTFEILGTLETRLLEIDRWIAMAHDVCCPTNVLGPNTYEELKHLMDTVPKHIVIPEAEHIKKLYHDVSRTRTEMKKVLSQMSKVTASVTADSDELDLSAPLYGHDAAKATFSSKLGATAEVYKLVSHGPPLPDLIRLCRAADTFPITLTETEQLKKVISKCEALTERIYKHTPKQRNWRSSFLRKFLELKPLSFLKSLALEAARLGVHLVAVDRLLNQISLAEDWVSNVKRAMDNSSSQFSDVKAMSNLVKQVDSIPVDLSEERKMFNTQVRRAREWIERARTAIPRQSKTRGKAEFQRMDLDTLLTLQREATEIGVDISEVGAMSEVVEQAQSWLERARSAFEAIDSEEPSTTMEYLEELLDEVEAIPVEIPEQRQLEHELNCRHWLASVNEALQGGNKSLTSLKSLLREAEDLKTNGKDVPCSQRTKACQNAKRNELSSVCAKASSWVSNVQQVLESAAALQEGGGNSKKRQRKPDRVEISVVNDLLRKGKDFPVSLGSQVDRLKKLLDQALPWRKAMLDVLRKCENIEALSALERDEESILKQDELEPDVDMPSSDEKAEEDDVASIPELELNDKKHVNMPSLTNFLEKLSNVLIITQEEVHIRNMVEYAEAWVARFEKVFGSHHDEASAERLMGTEDNYFRYDQVDLVPLKTIHELAESAKHLRVELPSKYSEMLNSAIQSTNEWKAKCETCLTEYRDCLRGLSAPQTDEELKLFQQGTVGSSAGGVGEDASSSLVDMKVSKRKSTTSAQDEKYDSLLQIKMHNQEKKHRIFGDKDIKEETKLKEGELDLVASALEKLHGIEDVTAFPSPTLSQKIKVPPKELQVVLDRVVQLVQELMKQVRLVDGKKTVVVPSEFRECAWLYNAISWQREVCNALDVDSASGLPTLQDWRQTLLEGHRLVANEKALEELPVTTMVSSSTGKRADRTLETASQPGDTKRVKTDESSDSASQGEAGGEDSGGMETRRLRLPWSVTMRSVEGSESPAFMSLGWCVLDTLDVLKEHVRNAVSWRYCARGTLRDAKTFEQLVQLKSLLLRRAELNLRVEFGEVKQIQNEVTKVVQCAFKVRELLKNGPALLDDLEDAVQEAGKLRVTIPEVSQIKQHIRSAKAWENKLMKSGIEKGEASVDALKQLLNEAREIPVDLSQHTSVLRQATRQYCLCHRGFEGTMIQCCGCGEWFHTACLGLSQGMLKKLTSMTCHSCLVRDLYWAMFGTAKCAVVRTLAAAIAKYPIRVSTSKQLLNSEQRLSLANIDQALAARPEVDFGRLCLWVDNVSPLFVAMDKQWAIVEVEDDVGGKGVEEEEAEKFVKQVEMMAQQANASGIAECADVQHIMNMLRMHTWTCRLFKVLRKRFTYKDVSDLLSEASAMSISSSHAVVGIEKLCRRVKLWTDKVNTVLDSPPTIPSVKVVVQCKELLSDAKTIPFELPLEKALSACIEDNAQRYCKCRRFNDGSFMIGCDTCDEWYHGRCVNLSDSFGPTLKSFTCDTCCAKKGLRYSFLPGMPGTLDQQKNPNAPNGLDQNDSANVVTSENEKGIN